VRDDAVVERVDIDSRPEMVSKVGDLLARGPSSHEVRLYERGRPPRMIPAMRQHATRGAPRMAVAGAAVDSPASPSHSAPADLPPAGARLVDGPFPDFVHVAISRQARRHPERVAVIDDETGDCVSYAQLDRRVAMLGSCLRAAGVRADDCVAVHVDPSIDLVVAMLSALAAGGVFVPIATSLPPARVAALLERSQPAALITDRKAAVHDVGDATTFHPSVEGELAPGTADWTPELKLDDLAYVIYTSGSTGAPKGVAMTHRGLTRLIRWQVGDGPPALRTLQITPVGFDVTFQEICSTLCTGGTLVRVAGAVRRDPAGLLVSLERRAIQRLFLTCGALQQLAVASRRLGIVPRSLRHVIASGERLTVTPAIRGFFEASPECRLDNHYGPTEAHLVSSHTLGRDASAWEALPPIGKPVGGVRLYNLDAGLAPATPGEVGELFVAGDAIARGYLDAAALTAERFVPDPFSLDAGARMYKTGDAARVDDDGLVRFVGRLDDQIKLRGFRIEPAEVELALSSRPDVRAAAVVARPIVDGAEGLVAYVVREGVGATAAQLVRHVGTQLPEYMVPARIVFLDALPLTATGKLDRVHLRELALAAPSDVVAVGESPADTVRAIWERVLGHDEVEDDDDFFDVGGDSLLAAWVVAELSQVAGRDIELSVMLRDGTITGLARELEREAAQPARAPRGSEIVTLRPGPLHRPLFLVHPLGGDVLAYRELANAIRFPLRILGLRWRSVTDATAHVPSVEAMAATHRAQISAVQPAGPYLLAGWSFGGVLALEIARQLVADGGEVRFLGLLDANPIRDPITGLAIADSPHLALITGALDAIEELRDDEAGSRTASDLFAGPEWSGLLGHAVPDGVTASHLRQNLTTARAAMLAAVSHRPGRYDGAVDLFSADESAPDVQALLERDLRTIARGAVRVHRLSGDHCGILRAPLVQATARAMDSALGAI
jgi:amino acid adenylation domain-containing protein